MIKKLEAWFKRIIAEVIREEITGARKGEEVIKKKIEAWLKRLIAEVIREELKTIRQVEHAFFIAE